MLTIVTEFVIYSSLLCVVFGQLVIQGSYHLSMISHCMPMMKRPYLIWWWKCLDGQMPRWRFFFVSCFKKADAFIRFCSLTSVNLCFVVVFNLMLFVVKKDEENLLVMAFICIYYLVLMLMRTSVEIASFKSAISNRVINVWCHFSRFSFGYAV